MKIVKGKEIIDSRDIHISSNVKKVVVEIGSGDGKELYLLAKKNPENFYLGIEPNENSLEKITKKIYKKPNKGGLQNIIFLKASAQQIDPALEKIADGIFISFPWGSLLKGIMNLDPEVIEGIKYLAKPNTNLIITLTYDDKYEENYRKEGQMPDLSLQFLQTNFAKGLERFGLDLKSARLLPKEEKENINSSWGKKILARRERDVYELLIVISETV